MRPDITSYNEEKHDEEIIGKAISADITDKPDLLLVVGTTLHIPSAQVAVRDFSRAVAEQRGGLTAWINPSQAPSHTSGLWDMIVCAHSDEIAERAMLQQSGCQSQDVRAWLPEKRKQKSQVHKVNMPVPVIGLDGEPDREVENILSHRRTGDEDQFLVRWHGYSPQHDIWEPLESLDNAMEPLQEFLESQSAEASQQQQWKQEW